MAIILTRVYPRLRETLYLLSSKSAGNGFIG